MTYTDDAWENILIADALYDEYLEQRDEDDQVERRTPSGRQAR
jgi:hypothetical protein